MVPGGAAGEKGADKKTPDKGGNRASKTQKRVEGLYLFEQIKLNTLLTHPDDRERVALFQINPVE